MSDALSTQSASEQPRIAAFLDRIRSLLVADERLLAYAVQRRGFALTARRLVVACTTGRLILMRRRLISGYHMIDVRWQDLRDAKLDEGLISSSLTVIAVSQTLTVGGLRKEQAEAVYRVAQGEEQAWREKNRVREMEELRARSGGIQLNTGTAGEAAGNDSAVRLQRAKTMLQQGLISDAEYESVKAKILSSL